MLGGVSWVWWLIGTFGIAGTIALAIFAPSALMLVWNAISKVLVWMLQTRVGCAILAFIIAFLIADIHRSRLDEASWKKQIAAFEAAQTQRDADIAADVRKTVTDELAKDQKADVIDVQEKKDFEQHLDPAKACLVGDDAVGLRNRGPRRLEGQHLKGLRKARAHRGGA